MVQVGVLLEAEESNPVEVGVAPSLSKEDTPRPDGPGARPHTNSAKKLNENQRTLVETLAAAGGRVPIEALRGLNVPRTTLGTLVRRGLVLVVGGPPEFYAS